jgi:transcriptional regulator with XRE-family HTH domain
MSNRIPEDDGDAIVRLGKAALGAAVKSARLSLGLSQRQLGSRASVSQPVISRLENGRLNGIRWQTLARIIGVLRVRSGHQFRCDAPPPGRRLPGQRAVTVPPSEGVARLR